MAHHWQENWSLLWSIWQTQRRDAGGEWQETGRFPRLEEIREDKQGRWQRRDLGAHEDNLDWQTFCPPELRILLEGAVQD